MVHKKCSIIKGPCSKFKFARCLGTARAFNRKQPTQKPPATRYPPFKPVVVGSIPGFSSLSNETLNRGQMDKLLTKEYCLEAGDYAMHNVLSPRDLVFRPDVADINCTTTKKCSGINGPYALTHSSGALRRLRLASKILKLSQSSAAPGACSLLEAVANWL